MDQQTQTAFAEQLAHWAEDALRQGRFPFRKIETSPRLHTSLGEIRPPLVLWINRDSFMAGGLVFFPSRQAEESLPFGGACADALGLSHFVVWAPREVSFWQTGSSPRRHRTIALQPAESLTSDDFQTVLLQVMEELKVLAVTGAVPTESLSPFYFTNLCIETLDEIIPSLTGTFRIRIGEQHLRRSRLTPEELAAQKAALVVLRLFALVIYDQLPTTVQPEGIERAMKFALDNLPPPLHVVLQATADEPPLPSEETVRVHHLFRRLAQLHCGEDRHRAVNVLKLLLENLGRNWGGVPLAEPRPDGPQPLLLVNPDNDYAVSSETLEVASPPFLAATALLRALTDRPAANRQVAEVFALDQQQRPNSVWGTLYDRHQPDAIQKQALSASLRLSWPARRFTIPPRTPRWVWEWLHILGLCQQGAHLVLNLPDDCLSAGYAGTMLAPVREHFTLHRLRRPAEGLLELTLTKSEGDGSTPVLIEGPEETRSLAWETLRDGPASLLALALDLPKLLWELFEDGKLAIPTIDRPLLSIEGLFRYTRSTLGSFLWDTVSGSSPLPDRDAVAGACVRYGLPLPSSNVLSALAAIESDGTEATSSLDAELAQWLGEIALPADRAGSAMATTYRRPSAAGNWGKLLTRISGEVFRDGVPRFPEQYLYGYLHPPLIDYQLAGPLTVRETFFDQVTLIDETGGVLQVEGGCTAQALRLASATGRTAVSLPAEQQLTADILERYRTDLKQLRQTLARSVYVEVAERRRAEALIDRIWDNQFLPPWSLVDD